MNKDYNTAGLPGCVGSMDVVHVKWSHSLTGDHNCVRGKEGYPTLGFQCKEGTDCGVESYLERRDQLRRIIK